MTTSLPSSPILSIDLPDVRNFKSEFVYNFFVPDEKVNDTGQIPEKFKNILRTASEAIDSSTINTFTKKIPRLVKFSFSKVRNRKNTEDTLSSIGKNANTSFIRNNIDKLILEENFLRNNFVSIDFQDNNIDDKLFNFVSASIESKIASNNEKILTDVEQAKTTLFDRLSKNNSILDKAKTLKLFNTEVQNNQLILDALTKIENLGARYINETQQKEEILSLFDDVKNLKIGAQINKKFFGTISNNISSDPMSIYSDEFKSVVAPAESIEQLAVSSQSSKYMFESEYKFVVEKNKILVQQNEVSSDVSLAKSSVETIGFLIEKVEINDDGSLIFHDPIIIENNRAVFAFDPKVKYGKKYIYSIRTVNKVRFVGCEPSTNSLQIVEVMIASRKSNSSFITVEEKVPPPPPADFNISWDYKVDAPRLTWNFPVNLQRDIKKFQVFKRKEINEPFELIKEFDFDDSVIKTPNFETPNQDLVVKTSIAITHFIDKEFVRKHSSFSFLKTDKFIYAVRSIDAHGMGSNYSAQFEISFDNFKNKIVKKRISASGAPMQYPNLFLLNNDTFIDAIKISNRERMTVYFNPDFYDVLTEEGERVKTFLSTKFNGNYKIGIINLDFQKQVGIDMEIEDLGGRS